MTTESNHGNELVSEPAAQPTDQSPLTAVAGSPEQEQDREPEPAPTPEKAASVAMDESLGLRLRAAREARGLSCEAAAQQLRLPVTVLQAIEAERFERIGHAIYLRSYLTKYLRLLDLPQVLAERVLQERAEPLPPLVTTGTVSHPRYLFERYSGSALYLILTAVIVVPAVLLAMRAGFDQNLVRVTPLEATEISTPALKPQDAGTGSVTATATSESVPQPVSTAPAETAPPPVIASMTPFPPAAQQAQAKSETPATSPGEHTLRLSLAEASWVEIVAADGQKLEYGLLPAGSSRSYASSKPLDIRIGNADGATLEVDGKAKDIMPFRHSNVAHFKIADGETSTAAHSGG